MSSIQEGVVNKFLHTHGKAAARIVNILAKREKFKRAIETEIGAELMIDALNRMETIIGKIIDDKETPQERAEFRALREIVDKWQDKLAEYNRALLQVAENRIGEKR